MAFLFAFNSIITTYYCIQYPFTQPSYSYIHTNMSNNNIKCTHPVRVGGLCCLCGAKAPDPEPSDDQYSNQYNTNNGSNKTGSNDSFVKSQNLTVGGGYTIQVTASEASLHSSRQRTRLRSLRKLSLILDLDHTLVHCVDHEGAGVFCEDERMEGSVRNFLLPAEHANLEKGGERRGRGRGV